MRVAERVAEVRNSLGQCPAFLREHHRPLCLVDLLPRTNVAVATVHHVISRNVVSVVHSICLELEVPQQKRIREHDGDPLAFVTALQPVQRGHALVEIVPVGVVRTCFPRRFGTALYRL
jgi:hypothetical protein